MTEETALKPIETDFIQLQDRIKNLPDRIESEDQERESLEAQGLIRKFLKFLEVKRLEFTKPANEALKKWNSTFHIWSDPLNDRDKNITRSLSDWKAEQEAVRRREALKALEEAEKFKTKLPIPEIVAPVPPAPPKVIQTVTGSAGYTTKTKYEILNQAEVPRLYLMIDEVKVGKAVSAGILTAEDKWLRIWKESIPVHRG